MMCCGYVCVYACMYVMVVYVCTHACICLLICACMYMKLIDTRGPFHPRHISRGCRTIQYSISCSPSHNHSHHHHQHSFSQHHPYHPFLLSVSCPQCCMRVKHPYSSTAATHSYLHRVTHVNICVNNIIYNPHPFILPYHYSMSAWHKW